MSMSAMCFPMEIMFILKAIKSQFKGSFDKENLILVVISYEKMTMGCKILNFHYKSVDWFESDSSSTR